MLWNLSDADLNVIIYGLICILHASVMFFFFFDLTTHVQNEIQFCIGNTNSNSVFWILFTFSPWIGAFFALILVSNYVKKSFACLKLYLISIFSIKIKLLKLLYTMTNQFNLHKVKNLSLIYAMNILRYVVKICKIYIVLDRNEIITYKKWRRFKSHFVSHN